MGCNARLLRDVDDDNDDDDRCEGRWKDKWNNMSLIGQDRAAAAISRANVFATTADEYKGVCGCYEGFRRRGRCRRRHTIPSLIRLTTFYC